MKVFVWDTETTGFTQKDQPLEKQPWIVQFGGIMAEVDPTTGEYSEISRINEIIKPPVAIPFASSQVHGIYDKDVIDKKPLEDHIGAILKLLNEADAVCGHNIEFDEAVLNYQLERLNRKGDYQPKSVVDTMKESVDFCKLQGRGFRFKYPKLNELYKKLFNEHFEGAHDAMIDVEATLKAMGALIKHKVITLEENEVMRLF